jgi:hypothetical protein
MILENRDLLQNYHVDFGEDLRGYGDEDCRDLIYDCLVESQLIEVCLE